jgi:uncharacterized membrane protein YuzA (DUF378 family)
MDTLYSVSFLISILGALQWGIIGIGGFLGKNLNLISFLSRGNSTIEYSIYIVIGIFALVYIKLSAEQ